MTIDEEIKMLTERLAELQKEKDKAVIDVNFVVPVNIPEELPFTNVFGIFIDFKLLQSLKASHSISSNVPKLTLVKFLHSKKAL
jgi:hypothetical protein